MGGVTKIFLPNQDVLSEKRHYQQQFWDCRCQLGLLFSLVLERKVLALGGLFHCSRSSLVGHV